VQAGPLVCRRADAEQPEQHCTLLFPAAQAAGGSSSNCGTFGVQHYMSALDTRVLGRVLLTAGSTTSTQVLVQENAARLPNGLTFIADKQYGGKGERVPTEATVVPALLVLKRSGRQR